MCMPVKHQILADIAVQLAGQHAVAKHVHTHHPCLDREGRQYQRQLVCCAEAQNS